MATIHDYISDKHAILLLTTRFRAEQNSEIKPLGLRSFNNLARRIASSSVSRPGTLLELSEKEIHEQLEIDEQSAKLIGSLLNRRHSLAVELAHLEELGIKTISRAEPDYPRKLFEKLKQLAPPIIFYSGELSILYERTISIVGSRNLSQSLLDTSLLLGEKCSDCGAAVISGGARGADLNAMMGSLGKNGLAVGVVADSLKSIMRKNEISGYVRDGRLVLLSAFPPWEGFTVWKAMDRNKYIYSLSDFGVVVRSDLEKGGTWAGAVECIEKKYCPLFVLDLGREEKGNDRLIKMAGIPLNPEVVANERDICRLLSRMIERNSCSEVSGDHNEKQLPLWF
ncbi:DNA-processing protein DprA [Mesotoga prima]|uniref:DNA-processing protein DprA n=1 Tax=Mesotoga prima TaxID=1184387 RepID=UPI001BD6D2F5|nr:DNA-processing protein DprA [Mesotoga prima]HQC15892.1 DNA-processing protein DprA [Mesotoga prima]